MSVMCLSLFAKYLPKSMKVSLCDALQQLEYSRTKKNQPNGNLSELEIISYEKCETKLYNTDLSSISLLVNISIRRSAATIAAEEFALRDNNGRASCEYLSARVLSRGKK